MDIKKYMIIILKKKQSVQPNNRFYPPVYFARNTHMLA